MHSLLASLLAAALPLLPQAPASAPPAPLPTAAPVPVQAGPFDATRDAKKDLEAAKAEASKSGKRILVDVGGNWCSWCRLLDRFFSEQKALKELRDQHFVVVMINYSKEHPNTDVLSQWPSVKGYPHFFVLDASGKLLHSQNTGELEEGKGYSVEKTKQFINTWGKPKS